MPNLLPLVGSEDAEDVLELEKVLTEGAEDEAADEEDGMPRLPVEWSIQVALTKGMTGV